MWCRYKGVGLVLAAALLAASCSSPAGDQKPVFPVRGQVFYQDKPAAGAFILFVPVNEPAEPKDPRPRATVEKDGSFALSTYGDKDGAPAGEYIVTVTWPGPEQDDRLQGHYADKGKKLLRATVKEAPNDLPVFKLKQ